MTCDVESSKVYLQFGVTVSIVTFCSCSSTVDNGLTCFMMAKDAKYIDPDGEDDKCVAVEFVKGISMQLLMDKGDM